MGSFVKCAVHAGTPNPVLVETRFASGSLACRFFSTPLMCAMTTPEEVVSLHFAFTSSIAGNTSPASQLNDRVTEWATVIMGYNARPLPSCDDHIRPVRLSLRRRQWMTW